MWRFWPTFKIKLKPDVVLYYNSKLREYNYGMKRETKYLEITFCQRISRLFHTASAGHFDSKLRRCARGCHDFTSFFLRETKRKYRHYITSQIESESCDLYYWVAIINILFLGSTFQNTLWRQTQRCRFLNMLTTLMSDLFKNFFELHQIAFCVAFWLSLCFGVSFENLIKRAYSVRKRRLQFTINSCPLFILVDFHKAGAFF